MGKKKKSKQPHFKKRFKKPQRVLIKKEKKKLKTKKIKLPKNRASKKKIKQLKRATKKPQEVLFKIKSLGRAKKSKIKKSSKPTKPRVRKTKPVKLVKPKKPKLAKPIESPIYRTRVKMIGIGGGGSSIVSEIAPEVKRANFVVANTDRQALQAATRKAKHFQFGQRLAQGLGTGMNPELGEMAAQEEKERIKKLLKGTDFCILVSCLGGGTGSGTSPVFAEISRKLRNVTLGIFTLPFDFEGEKRMEIAKSSLEKLRQHLNALIIIPNENIFKIIDKNIPLKDALSTINKQLAVDLEGLIEMTYPSGLIMIDWANLKTILREKGKLVFLNTIEIQEENQIEELTKKILSNPLSPYSPKEATGILFNVAGGLNLNIGQVEQIGKIISEAINPKAKIAFGITRGKADKIKITLLANGCKWKEWEEKKTTTLPPPEVPRRKSRKVVRESASHQGQAPKLEKKVKVRKKIKRKLTKLPKVPQLEVPQPFLEEEPKEVREEVKIKIRRNALDLREAVQEEEKRLLAKERKWETPAILRRNSSSQTDEEDE